MQVKSLGWCLADSEYMHIPHKHPHTLTYTHTHTSTPCVAHTHHMSFSLTHTATCLQRLLPGRGSHHDISSPGFLWREVEKPSSWPLQRDGPIQLAAQPFQKAQPVSPWEEPSRK